MASKCYRVMLKLCFVLLMTTLGSMAAISDPIHEASNDARCQVSPSFQSPYVTLLLEERSKITGCISQTTTNKSQEVHFISLANSGFRVQANSDFLPTVALHVEPRLQQSTHAGPLVIVLHTPSPVMWHLDVDRISNTSRLTIVVTHRSQVMPLLPLKFRLLRKNRPTEKRLLAWVKQQYGAITTVARIERANEITLRVGIDDEAPNTCDLEIISIPANVNAFYVQPQPAEGCIGEGTMDGKSRDVHVIELLSGGNIDSVMVHLQPHGQRKITLADKPVVQKDLLLVLSCHKEVMWKVKSWGIKGSLHVVAQYPLSRENLPNYQSLHVEAETLPNTTKSLLASVEKAFGPVNTFTKARIANKVKIFVEGKDAAVKENEHSIRSSQSQSQNMQSDGDRNNINKTRLTNSTTVSSLSAHNASFPFHSPSLSEHLYPKANKIALSNARVPVLESSDMQSFDESTLTDSNHLIKETLVQCKIDELNAAISQEAVMWLAHRLTGTNNSEIYLTFKDLNCVARTNGSHYILHAKLDGCGTTKTVENNIVYHNQILFWVKAVNKKSTNEDVTTISETLLDDEDINIDSGSGAEPPLKLHNDDIDNKDKLLLPLSFRCVYKNSQDDAGEIQQSGVAHPHVYRMDIYTKNSLHPVPDEAFPLDVHVHDHILVETRIDAGPHLSVVTDKCWLSDLPYPGLQSAKKTELIRDSCPTDLSVKLRNENQDPLSQRTQRFSFQIGDDFIDTVTYLHCRLTACSNAPLPRPDNVKKCMNPEQYCEKQSLRPFLEKSPGKHFSLEVRGPLRVLPKLRWEKPIKPPETFFPVGSFPRPGGLPINPSMGKSHGKDPENGVPHVIVIGLSTEAVVGIAFASFVIGAGLMAILWYIHLRTDPLRNERGRHPHITHPSHHHPLHSGYDLSGHSGSSTPSSQAPMTGHACTSPGQT